jgi:uncharacterized repeat protein (TIGR03803 family)
MWFPSSLPHLKFLLLGLLGAVLMVQQTVAAGQLRETVIYNFRGLPDGRYPATGLVMDKATGALLGTTGWGGSGDCPYVYPPAAAVSASGYRPVGCGTVFRLDPPTGGGEWKEAVIYSFTSQGVPNEADANPSGLFEDRNGVFYGTTFYGGRASSGTVFALSRPVGDRRTWLKTDLVNFTIPFGINPYAEVMMDNKSGALYGATSSDGPLGPFKSLGTLYRLVPPSGGKIGWTPSVLFNFTGRNGATPAASLIMDGSGALYGTTLSGGVHNFGEVFRVDPSSKTEKTLFSFDGAGGAYPQAPVIIDRGGALAGTTSSGGPFNVGTIFELRRFGSAWKQTVLWGFSVADGASPTAGLIKGADGALYGTTSGGGKYHKGTVFKLTPPSLGAEWTLTVLHAFSGGDGDTPAAPLIMDDAGALYGTTLLGGSQNYGVVFKIAP